MLSRAVYHAVPILCPCFAHAVPMLCPCCADVAPFVGHNALLRWSAIQEVAFVEDGIRKFWAEDTVSEDFEQSLR